MEKRFILIAPHADDEVIGCYEFLQKGLVVRVLFPNDKIMTEAFCSSDHFRFGRELIEDHKWSNKYI